MKKLITPACAIASVFALGVFSYVAFIGGFEHNPAWLSWVFGSGVIATATGGTAVYRFVSGRKLFTGDEEVPKPVTDQKQKDRDAIYWLTERLRDNAEAVKRLKEINASLFDKHHNLTEAGNADK